MFQTEGAQKILNTIVETHLFSYEWVDDIAAEWQQQSSGLCLEAKQKVATPVDQEVYFILESAVAALSKTNELLESIRSMLVKDGIEGVVLEGGDKLVDCQNLEDNPNKILYDQLKILRDQFLAEAMDAHNHGESTGYKGHNDEHE